jgi:hypothetical protein
MLMVNLNGCGNCNPDNQYKEYETNLCIGIYKTTHIFMYIFCSKGIAREMDVVSEKFLCRFYILKRNTRYKNPS